VKNLLKKILRMGTAPAATSAAQLAAVAAEESPYDKFLSDELKRTIVPGDELMLKYPSLQGGLWAATTGSDLLRFHKDKINKIANGIGLPPDKFKLYIEPVIYNFADFVHMLPASRAHHHAGPSGLLTHCLEVATLAVNTAQSTSFDHGGNPSKRTLRRERWYAASVFAALLHDAGKPLTDLIVHDDTQTNIWPGTNTITQWAAEAGIVRFHITWNQGRGEKHKALSTTLIERLIPIETRNWLVEGGQDLYHAMVDAISGADTKSTLTGIVIKSDSSSVEMDLRDHNGDASGLAGVGALAVNVPNKFTQAARYLVESGAWTANGQGSRIWTTTQGVFLVWKGAVDDVISYFDQNKVKGTPRGPDSLGNVLLDFGLFEANPDGDLYWVVAPDALANPETGKVIRLKCVKLASHQTLYPFDVPPQPIGIVLGEEGSEVRYDPVDGGLGVALDANVAPAADGAPVGPMFSLDTPAKGPSSPAPAQVAAPAAVPAGGIQLGAQAPAAGAEPRKANAASRPAGGKQGEPKGPRQKSAVELGISLQTLPTKPESAIHIGSTPEGSGASDGLSAVNAIKARLAGPAAGGSSPAIQVGKEGGKKNQSQGGSQKPAAQAERSKKAAPGANSPATAQSKPVAVPAPEKAASPVPPAPPIAAAALTPDLGDAFANLSHITLEDMAPASDAEAVPEGDWPDPFAPAENHAAEELQAFTSEREIGLDGEEDFDQPVIADVSLGSGSAGEEPSAAPMFAIEEADLAPHVEAPSLAVSALPVASVPSASASPEVQASAGDDDLWLNDFDAEILAQTGLPQPTFVAREKAKETAAPPARKDDGQPKIHIPSEFMSEFQFSDEPEIGFKEFKDIPAASPSGYVAPPASIEIRVRESAATADELNLVGIDLSEFDMPEISAGVVKGEVGQVLVQSDQPEHQEEPFVLPAPESQPLPAPVEPAVQEKSKKLLNQASVRPRRLPAAELDAKGIVLSAQPAPKGPSPKVEIARAEVQRSSPAITLGPKPRRPKKDAAVQEKADVIAIRTMGPGRLRSKLSEAEAAEAEAFLGRFPELGEKLYFYAANCIKEVVVVNWRPLLQFHEDGFTEADVPLLERAMWLWEDFASESGAAVRPKGVIVSPYVTELICHLSGGAFDITKFYPPSQLDIVKLKQLAEMAIADCTSYKVQGDHVIYTLTPNFIKKTAVRFDISEHDLQRALISTHDVSKQRNNLLVQMYSKDAPHE
jgi:hypothetical protein